MHLQTFPAEFSRLRFVVVLVAVHFLSPAASGETEPDRFDISCSFCDTLDEVDGKFSPVEKGQLQEAKSLYEQDRLFSSYRLTRQLLENLTNNCNRADG